MFTGLVETVAEVRSLRATGQGAELQIASAPLAADGFVLGESIAVNGACLTVTKWQGDIFSVDVSPETLERTTIGRLQPGSKVNLERALRLSDRLGGHLVSGHVDALGSLVEKRRVGNSILLKFRLAEPSLRYIIEKGSITIEGISLTVNELNKDGFSVAIIPHTLSETTLQSLSIGGEVNIETDMIGKYVERLLSTREDSGGMNLDFLAKNGFL